MFAILGNIKFDILSYINDLDESSTSNYAEHAVIDGKPQLQYMGENLDEINFSIKLHISYCNPAIELNNLKYSKARHEALPFIYGNGDYVGDFVITEIRKRLVQNDNLGNIIAIDADIKLKEYVETEALSVKKTKKKKKVVKKKLKKSSVVKKKAHKPDKAKIKQIKSNVEAKKTESWRDVMNGVTRKEWLDIGLKSEAGKVM